MKEKYDVFCFVDGANSKANIFLNENEYDYQIEFIMNSLRIITQSENYFYALLELRKNLEKENIKLLCKGCSKNVYPSPMILGMGDAIEAYQLTIGKPALTKDLVNIFEPCDLKEYATIKEQHDYYEDWVRSEKG